MRDKPKTDDSIEQLISKAPIKEGGKDVSILLFIPEYYHTKLKVLAAENKLKLKELGAKIIIDFIDKIEENKLSWKL